MDPADGTFTMDTGDYSPAALVFIDFTWRLSGVRQLPDGIEWNVRPPAAGITASYRRKLSSTRVAEIRYASGRAELLLNDRMIYATAGTIRLVTDAQGRLRSAAGVDATAGRVALTLASGQTRTIAVQPNVRSVL